MSDLDDFKKKKAYVSAIKSKRKWKHLAEQLDNPELEQEEEENGKTVLFNIQYLIFNILFFIENFIDTIKEGRSIYNKNLRNRYDEFGTEFTAFNMREELEEGNIDDTGYYVYHKNED